VCDFLKNYEYRENLFFNLCLDGLKKLRQKLEKKKMYKILVEFDI
jgi:hypothetical protein